VVGLGVDVADVDRIAAAFARRGARFAERVLHPAERRLFSGRSEPGRVLAEAFALKEACLKALGTGWASGIAFHHVERRDPAGSSGAVGLVLHGPARARAHALGAGAVHASVSSTPEVACALVVLVARGGSGSRPT